jgi:hypothetical protein
MDAIVAHRRPDVDYATMRHRPGEVPRREAACAHSSALGTRLENGRTMGYHVYFARDAKGLWKVLQF